MPTILSRSCAIPAHGLSLRRFVLAAVLLSAATLLVDSVEAQDFIREGRDAARAWTLHKIAVIEAARGNVDDAKNTVAQIDEPAVIRGAGDVTGVCFCNGLALYDHPPAPAGWTLSELAGSQVFLNRYRAPDHVPAAAPRGLPSDYLAANPRHGAVVNFSDECDSSGTRVTSRRYADGYVVIETPRSETHGR